MHLFNQLFPFSRNYLFIVLFITLSAISCSCTLNNPSGSAGKKHKPEEALEQAPPKLPGKQHEPENGPPQNEQEKKDREDAYAQYRLGIKYYNLGTEKSLNKAFELFQQAATKSKWNAEAQYMLGIMHYLGRGVERNDKQAVEWLERSAEQGQQEAQFFLGWMYDTNGIKKEMTIEKDDQAALKWYKAAADQGYWLAQFYLGRMYERGSDKVAQDFEKAFECYTKAAADPEDVKAKYRLARMYEKGRGVKRDYAESKRLYEIAIKYPGSNIEKYRLGRMYEKGRGVPQDYIKAREWYQASPLSKASDRLRWLDANGH